MNAVEFLAGLFVTSVVVTDPNEQTNSQQTIRSDPAMPVESEVVGGNRPANASVGDSSEPCEAVRNNGPRPCGDCGSAIFWKRSDGSAVCCHNPRPAGAVGKAIIVTLPDDRTAWETFEGF